MPAYNYGRYVGRAVQSALDQDYPPGRLRIVVVDDGSTDDTAAVVRALADANPDRVTLIQQVNAGASAAINRALAEADGELVAVLDADDVWLPEKTRRQAELLRDDPALGMVFCDMRVVDGQEALVRPSQVGDIGTFPRRAFARLLFQNVATQSSIMIRRELARPLPPEIAYSDWWFAICAAQASEVQYLGEPLALYREHGANLTSGVSGASAVREHRKEIAFQLWVLRNLDLSPLRPAETKLVWDGVEEHARRALMAAGTMFVELTEIGETERHRSAELEAVARTAHTEGDLAAACVHLLAALGNNPFGSGIRARLDATVEQALVAARLPDPLEGARGVVVLADAEDLLADDETLAAYARAVTGLDGVSLAIDATRLPSDAAQSDLRALVERCGLADRDDLDLIAIVGELEASQLHGLRERAVARYQIEAGAESKDKGTIPTFTPETISSLRKMVV